jgi:hypothetical protein
VLSEEKVCGAPWAVRAGVLKGRAARCPSGDGFRAWASWPRERRGCEVLERKKGIRWMPWHQEAMKDVARCEKPRGAASRR